MTAAGALSAVGKSGSLEVQEGLGVVTGGSATLRIEESVSAYAGDKVSLATSEVAVDVDTDVNVFAGDTAKLTTYNAKLEARNHSTYVAF